MIPGYRGKWENRYSILIREIHSIFDQLELGKDTESVWVDMKDGPRLHGFPTEPGNFEAFLIIKRKLPANLPASHYRLVKDVVTRYYYPHLRPDLGPSVKNIETMFGFHGQHKDAISDLPNDESEKTKLATAFKPDPDDIILDCGCFLGFGELSVAPLLSAGHIYAVEAESRCYEIMEQNIDYNGVKNVTPLHNAIWDLDGKSKLETGFAQANTLIKEVQTGIRTQTTPTITIDGLVKQLGIAKLDMVSLTINGAEIEALKGAKNTLATLRPRIRLAGWYTRNGEKIWSIAKPILEAARYKVWIGNRGNVMALPKEQV